MNPGDYRFLTHFLRQASGLSLGEGKEYLVEGRLAPVALSAGYSDLAELVRALRRQPARELVDIVTEAMTTNETLFFRDIKPFDDMRDQLLPQLIAARKTTRKLRIWSAAAATGQEAWSLAMLLRSQFPELRDWNVEIVGTDLSASAIQRAREGVYSQFEVQRGLPVQMLIRFFEQTDSGWRIRDELRDMVRFQELNLLHSFSALGTFDVVFCRNVLIYFDEQTRSSLLNRMARSMAPDGCLLPGSAETIHGTSDRFQLEPACRSTVYRLAGFTEPSGQSFPAADRAAPR